MRNYLQPTKYGNRKTKIGGEVYDSEKEATRAYELNIMQRAGLISGLQRQVKYTLIPAQKENGKVVERELYYIADFVYTDQSGRTIVEDVKGYRNTADSAYRIFSIKRKLMRYIHGIIVKEI